MQSVTKSYLFTLWQTPKLKWISAIHFKLIHKISVYGFHGISHDCDTDICETILCYRFPKLSQCSFVFKEFEITVEEQRHQSNDTQQEASLLDRKRISLQKELEEVRTALEVVSSSKASHKRFTNFTQTSHKLHTNFTQTSHKLHTNFTQKIRWNRHATWDLHELPWSEDYIMKQQCNNAKSRLVWGEQACEERERERKRESERQRETERERNRKICSKDEIMGRDLNEAHFTRLLLFVTEETIPFDFIHW